MKYFIPVIGELEWTNYFIQELQHFVSLLYTSYLTVLKSARAMCELLPSEAKLKKNLTELILFSLLLRISILHTARCMGLATCMPVSCH